MTSELRLVRNGERVTLTLDRPESRNALSVSLRDAISDTLDALADDPSVKVAVITGTGTVFSSGFDLKEFERAASDDDFSKRLWASSDRFHRTVLLFPLPIIAAINGPAVAGGFDLAVMCDIRVASTTARFSHPERSFGDVVYGPLHDAVGGTVARDLTIGGRELTAVEALDVHFLSEVVEPGDLQAEIDRRVAMITTAPRDVLLRTKAKALRRAGYSPSSNTLDL